MDFKYCKKISNILREDIKSKLLDRWKNYCQQYNIECAELYSFTEWQDNPNPKSFRDDTIYIHHEGDFGANFSLKGCNHINFNFKIVLYNNDLYFAPGVYYYSHYIRDELFRMSQQILTTDNVEFSPQTYKQWVDDQPQSEQRMAQHNFKIDTEDLLKLNIKI